MKIFLETARKKSFAIAADWPGWSRAGKDPQLAMENLHAYHNRYAKVLAGTPQASRLPPAHMQFHVAATLLGNATTAFGAPDAVLPDETAPVDDAELTFWLALCDACWHTFTAAVMAAAGRELRKGPRGGGRDQARIIKHVLEGQQGYLRRIAYKPPKIDLDLPVKTIPTMSRAAKEALEKAVTEGLPEKGPRGGKIWTPRFYIRRTAWHLLDHAWEIEDRLL
jgi:hypothetical protein